MKRERAARRSLVCFSIALVPLTLTALAGRPGAGGAALFGVLVAAVGVYELVRGAE